MSQTRLVSNVLMRLKAKQCTCTKTKNSKHFKSARGIQRTVALQITQVSNYALLSSVIVITGIARLSRI